MGGSYGDDQYISPSDDSSGPHGSTGTSPSRPPPGQPSREAGSRSAVTTVFPSDGGRWYFRDKKRQKVFVRLEEDNNSEEETRYYFMQNGKRQYVKRDTGKGKR
jgi:hypothetical protein